MKKREPLAVLFMKNEWQMICIGANYFLKHQKNMNRKRDASVIRFMRLTDKPGVTGLICTES